MKLIACVFSVSRLRKKRPLYVEVDVLQPRLRRPPQVNGSALFPKHEDREGSLEHACQSTVDVSTFFFYFSIWHKQMVFFASAVLGCVSVVFSPL